MKKTLILLALSLFSATAAFAADGKVLSVADGQAVVQLPEKTTFKKGAGVTLNGKAGKVTEADGSKVTIKAPNAAELKAGDTVKVEKPAQLQGC